MSDDKKKNVSRETLPSCVNFGLRYYERLSSKFDGKKGFDWMTSEVLQKWFLACHVYELLHGMADDYDQHDYKLFILLGYKLIDLVSSVNFALNKFVCEKEN